MVSRNFSGRYADGASNQGAVLAYGAVDTGKVAVMLVNTGGAQTCAVALAAGSATGACAVSIDAGLKVSMTQEVPARTSMVLVFDGRGSSPSA